MDCRGAVAWKKAARTKRDGGVTSPGMPRKPLPAPKDERRRAPSSCPGAEPVEIDVVVQVGQLPLEARGVGQHPEGVLVEDRTSVDDLQHKLPARSVGEAPVHGRGPRIDRHDTDPPDSLLHLVHRAALAEEPRHQLQVGDALVAPRRVVRLIPPVAGEVEQPGREPLLVEPLGHELLLLDGQPDIAVAGREAHAVDSLRGVGALRISARHDDIAAVEVAPAPLDGPGHDAGPVCCAQRDSRAGLGPRRQGQPQKEAPDRHTAFHHIHFRFLVLRPPPAPSGVPRAPGMCRPYKYKK